MKLWGVVFLSWLSATNLWATRVYQSPMGDENWHASGSRLRCGLSLNVPNFGTAYFEQYAAKAPHFIMTKWQQAGMRKKARVYANPPVWKPRYKRHYVTTTSLRPGKYGLFLSRNDAIKVLHRLAKGYRTEFHYRSEFGDAVKVNLSPIYFQKEYAKYMKCVANLLPFDYDMVRHKVLYYGNDEVALTDKMVGVLEKIRLYVLVDRTVREVKIAGYSDNKGRYGYNNAISQQRAEAVKNYLLRRGVPARKLKITWFGEKSPQASNKTEQGRAKNRRVVINLNKV